MLAALVDDFSGLLYGLSTDKGKKPKPVPRPGEVDETVQRAQHQGLPMTLDQADRLRRMFEAPRTT